MPEIEKLGPGNWAGLLEAPQAVLILGTTTCAHCARWAEELGEFVQNTSEFDDVRFAKLDLDTPGMIAFKRAQSWVAELRDLPHTSIWMGGEKRKEFLGGGVERLAKRLRRLRG